MDERLRAGDIIETSIEAVAFGGSGVGRVGGMVIFVPFTAAGDTVEAKIVEAKRNYCIGEIREILTPSSDRIEPVCPHFSICGGCQYQHISYEVQLKIKEKQVAESFERIGKIASPPVRAVIPSPQAFSYRGKADFHCIPGVDGQLTLGFMDTGGGRLVDIQRCDIADESINMEYSRLREMLASGEIPSHRRRYILWSETAYPPEKYITRRAGGKELRITNSGFFQGNLYLVDTLTQRVVEMCNLKEPDTVLDCYCGCGLFSLSIAPHVRKVTGMEIDGSAVECATYNAGKYGITNTDFYKGNVKNILGGLIREGVRANIILVDPPRTGCSRKTLSGLAGLNPERIIYISCNPATQARDIRSLIDMGFHLEELQPIDMFPQTKHIEVIASLVR